ncbi:MAG: prolyl aminopeptidase [Chloroflexi bacterium]|nr:prolyl aminopeptidase [Chloroflexota bacterium]
MLRVSDIHEVYWEESGSPDGTPVVFVHGGPGGGTSPDQRRFFDPAAYRIVLFDQRGCGKSTPASCLEENTTWDLVADMERIREHLGIDRWVVFGGSWGSTLALAYAETHPDRVRALVLRGIFLLRPKELRWYYQEGASFVYPDAWESFVAPIPEDERDDLVGAFHRRLMGDDPASRRAAAKAWSVWEASTSFLLPSEEHVSSFEEDAFADAFARIENHYFVNGGFFDHPDQLLDEVDRVRHIPAVIVQGRYDMPCPVTTAWELHRRWPEADFHIVPDAGHAAMEPGTRSLLVEACDRFRGIA